MIVQKPPTVEDERRREAAGTPPVRVSPETAAELDEAEWYAKAFQGEDAPQLTWRALGMGTVLGFFLSFTNIYIGLMTGWLFGVATSASLLSFSLWSALHRVGVVKTQMTLLETNCMQSTASAAGYSTGEPLTKAIPALLLLSVSPANPGGTRLPWLLVSAWVLSLAVLGVMVAIPLKRSFINHERLKFPSGTAAAVMLHELYGRAGHAAAQGRALFGAMGIGAIVPLLKDLELVKGVTAAGKLTRHALLPASSRVFDFVPRVSIAGRSYAPSDFGFKLDHGVALLGAGALVGVRVALSMVIGGLVLAFAITPHALQWEWQSPAGHIVRAATAPGIAYREIGIWFGAPLLASATLTSMTLKWRTVARSFSSFRGSSGVDGEGRGAAVEVPISWFAVGTTVAGVAVVLLAWRGFDVPPLYAALAIVMTLFLGVVTCRTVGEADLSASGAMGKIMQLTYGVLIPQSVTANLVTASITTGASVSAADLLNDLKSGYLLGAHPRRQWVAQLAGTLTGAVASCIGFYLLVPDATVLTGVDGADPKFAAPSAQQWKAIAEVFKYGLENLHPMARAGLAIGLAAGVVLALVETLPRRFKRFTPSSIGLGLGLIIAFPSLFSILIGAVAAEVWRVCAPRAAERGTIPMASGLMVGESLMGVIVAGLNQFVLK